MRTPNLSAAQMENAKGIEGEPTLQLAVDAPRMLEAKSARKAFDPLAAIESAYRLDVDDSEWLATLLRELQPILDDGLGVSGWFWRIHADSVEISKPTYLRCADALHDAYCTATQRGSVAGFRLVNAHGKFASNGEILGVRQLSALGPLPGGLVDQATLSVLNTPDSGLTLGGPSSTFARIPPRTRHVLRQIGTHIAAASRLRSALATETGAGTGAVFDAQGRLLDASPELKTTHTRRQLETVVRAARASRGQLRTESPAQALALWTALVEGKWTVVEQVDTDGKRFLVARRNDPSRMKLGGLSERERAILSLVAGGHPSKAIAHDLEMPTSSVSSNLKSALRKLGFRDRMELIRLTQAAQNQ